MCHVWFDNSEPRARSKAYAWQIYCLWKALCGSCASSSPVVPGLFYKPTMPWGTSHCSAPSPCWTACWSPVMEMWMTRRLLQWMCRAPWSCAGQKVCEAMSPLWIACSYMEDEMVERWCLIIPESVQNIHRETHIVKKVLHLSTW